MLLKTIVVCQSWLWADLGLPSVCVFVCVYSGYIMHHYNGIWGTCAPSGRNMHHGAQGRLYFWKNSGDPDDFLFWYVCLCGCVCANNLNWTCAHWDELIGPLINLVCLLGSGRPADCKSVHSPMHYTGTVGLKVPHHRKLWKAYLRLPDTYEAKIAKNGNFWTFWPVFQLIYQHYRLKRPWGNCKLILCFSSEGGYMQNARLSKSLYIQ